MPYNFGEMPEKKNENNMNFVKKILNYIYEHSKLIDLISLIMSSTLLRTILNIFYKSNAAKYYGIPEEYFELNTFLGMTVFIFIILFSGLGIVVYNECNKDKSDKLYCNLMIIIFCIIPTSLSYIYLSKILTFDVKSKFIITKALYLSELSFFLIMGIMFCIHFISFKYIRFNRERNQIPITKRLKLVPFLILSDIFIFLSMLNIMEINIFSSIENKKAYEIYYENGNSKAVITKIGEKYIVADCVIKKDKILEQMNDLIIYTKNYKEVSLDDTERSYQTFREVKVNKNKILKRNNNLIIYRRNYKEIPFEKIEKIMQLFELEN